MPSVDPALFRPEAVAPETSAMNADIVAKMSSLPDIWAFPAEMIREVRRQGKGLFPAQAKSPRARTEIIEGPNGRVPVRIIAPHASSGVYLHIHGGGWMLNQADFQDETLERIVEATGLACISVEYRLAPEHPYPAGPDDCETVALWLAGAAAGRFGTDRLFIGGESAGATLSAVTLLRLRDRHGLTPFRGANLVAGCYDLGMTPSARRFGLEKLVLTSRDIELFVRAYVPAGQSLRSPDVSPLYADLAGMPPALFSIGTRDALVDDTLFMATRWEVAGGSAALRIWPGGCHVFRGFDFPMAEAAFAEEIAFLRSH
ncbi:alpha/beta hydrolase [Labrys monachus]|uniref:Acetyl esterase/lipase n=1 Tax=Labrys monachus TaxID=217067 RepID=A0ABU0FDH4_9HYPH|nr:alpha/beta hydrolase [Labrys monachus]MDQ0392571.1 acetyl esterase/lipase [Labrys monachus]